MLQDWELAPVQAAPPYCGAGLVHVRVCVPPPQETEQAPQPLHPPLIGALDTETEPESVEERPAALVQVTDQVALPADHEREPELYEVLGAGTGWSVQLPEYVPVRVQIQLLASAEEDIVTVKGFGETTDAGETTTSTVGAEQLLFGGADGVVPVQVPAQPMEPVAVLVWSQAFGAEVRVQAEPYPDGSAGADAEQEPLHWIVPELVEPQELAEEVHAPP